MRVVEKLCQEKAIEAGVQQGSVLGPTLYNLYTHDIPKVNGTELVLYADVTTVITKVKNLRYLHKNGKSKVETWTKKWKVKINGLKSVTVLYTRKQKTQMGRMRIQGEQINYDTHAKYLGIIIDKT